jgi:hypothetical protein
MTNSTVPASILDKIAGLLSLAEKNSNVNESAVASAAAQTLLTKYRLTQADLAGHDVEKKESVEEAGEALFTGNRIAKWRKALIRAVVYSNGCRFYYSRQYDKTGHGEERSRTEYKVNVVLVGFPSDIAIVRYFFAHLDREIQRLFEVARVNGEIRGKTGGTSFKVGACNAISSRLYAAHSEQKAEAKKALTAGTSQAIVKLDAAEAEVDEYYKEISKKFGKAKKEQASNVDIDAYYKGVQAGKTVGLHKGLTGGSKGPKALAASNAA